MKKIPRYYEHHSNFRCCVPFEALHLLDTMTLKAFPPYAPWPFQPFYGACLGYVEIYFSIFWIDMVLCPWIWILLTIHI